MGKDVTRPVYDFLLSVDYALSHGPLDSINQIWVKDKPILCGQYTVNSIETIYIPERFGGDDAEGGVAGVVELYMGTDDQVSSEALSARFGATPLTWPGYVGVSHVFFRGATSGAAEVLSPGSDVLDGTLFSSDNGEGFVWSSNNPYFPEVRVHVTRFPRDLPIANPSIPASTGVIIEGAEATLENLPNGFIVRENPGIMFSGTIDSDTDTTGDSWYSQNGGNYSIVGGAPGWSFSAPRTFMGADPGTVGPQPYAPCVGGRILHWHPEGTNSLTSDDPSYDNGGYIEIPNTYNPLLSNGQYTSKLVGQSEGDISPLAAQIDTGQMVWAPNFSYSATIAAGGLTASMSATCYFYIGTGLGSKGNLVGTVNLTKNNITGGGPYGFNAQAEIAYRLPIGTRSLYTEIVVNDISNPGDTSGSYVLYINTGGVLLMPLPPVDHEFTYCQPNGDLTGFPDANPAAMIYEILVNEEWGKGENPANIDIDSFTNAAITLNTERMGMSQVWVQQDTIENLVQDILDHIKAFLFINPSTGLYQLKLLRADYDAASAPLLDETNCVAKKRKRRAWGETINEIVVSYTDPNTEDSATVSAQDDGNIAMQGSIVSETREYSGFRNPYIAQFVADRDVREAAYPLFSCVVEVDRSFWATVPGDVFRFSWAADGISEMVLRVMAINYGKPKSKKITLQVVEDIFSLDQTTYSDVPESIWSPEEFNPVPFDWTWADAAPLPLLQRNGFSVDQVDAEYPNQGVFTMGGYFPVYAGSAIDYQAHTPVANPEGGTSIRSVLTAFPNRLGSLGVTLQAEVESRVPAANIDQLTQGMARPGMMLAAFYDYNYQELMMLDFFDSVNSEWNIIRGVWDTLPDYIGASDYIFNFPLDGVNMDPHPRTAGESRTYRLLPRTTFGRLPYASAFNTSVVVTERAHLPFRPANCQLDGIPGFNGVPFYLADVAVPGQITATWSNRNRTMEDNTIMRWSDGNVTPEAGQTTTIRCTNLAGTSTYVEYTGLTGTSHVINIADFGGQVRGRVYFTAVNSFGESLMSYSIEFDLR